jgi:hypothetical protein
MRAQRWVQKVLTQVDLSWQVYQWMMMVIIIIINDTMYVIILFHFKCRKLATHFHLKSKVRLYHVCLFVIHFTMLSVTVTNITQLDSHEQWIWKNVEWNSCDLIWGTTPIFTLKGLRKTEKNHSQDSQCSSWYSNKAPPKCKSTSQKHYYRNQLVQQDSVKLRLYTCNMSSWHGA